MFSLYVQNSFMYFFLVNHFFYSNNLKYRIQDQFLPKTQPEYYQYKEWLKDKGLKRVARLLTSWKTQAISFKTDTKHKKVLEYMKGEEDV